MSLLAPLGLLGLAGLLALILIYVIKPNYQQKLISSTYLWKRSLKYRKKRVPINRLRNLLIFLCQFLALAALGLLLAQPVIPYTTDAPKNEKVVIIDASASMLVASDGETRFERAVAQVKEFAAETLSEEDGALSVIVADAEAYPLFSRMTAENLDEVNRKLDSLTSETLKCGYSSADMDGAAVLAEEVLRQNSETEVILYTATEYIDKKDFTVVNVSDEDDWNVAVLGCTPVLGETNTYSFSVDVGCYNAAKSVTVTCEIFGANKKTDSSGNTTAGVNLTASKTEYFNELSTEKTLTFTADDFEGGEPILSFEYMYVHVDEADSFVKDNTFNVYGGEPRTLRVQYSSSSHNNFFSGILRTLRESKKGTYQIEIKEVGVSGAKTEGFDLYIFEHRMPDILPKDGVVLLVDPDKAPEGSGLQFGAIQSVKSDSTLASGASHPLTKNIDPNRITVAKYREVLASEGYDELMYYNGTPVLLARNDANVKVVVLTLDLNQSSLAVLPDFPILIFNLFDCYLPATLTGNAFEVGAEVTLRAHGTDLTLDGPGGKRGFDALPATVIASQPGDYTVTQYNMKGEPEVEQFFVHIPGEESNITKRVDELPLLRVETTQVETNLDLILWIAAFALLLLFAEWWLHSRENV